MESEENNSETPGHNSIDNLDPLHKISEAMGLEGQEESFNGHQERLFDGAQEELEFEDESHVVIIDDDSNQSSLQEIEQDKSHEEGDDSDIIFLSGNPEEEAINDDISNQSINKDSVHKTKNSKVDKGVENQSSPICGASFVTQPPESLRKSNFFNFTVMLLDSAGEPLDIESAIFDSFIDDCPERNGMRYKVTLSRYPLLEEEVLLRLVDKSNGQLVPYVGNLMTPALSRVLLDHKSICSRCFSGQICGNVGETPSDPTVLSNNMLKFYLKCNQNCHVGAGNPGKSRRFGLKLFTSLDMASGLCESGAIFVHNNSKFKGGNGIRRSTYNTYSPKEPQIKRNKAMNALNAMNASNAMNGSVNRGAESPESDTENNMFDNGNPWNDPDEEIVLEFLKIFKERRIKDKIVLIERVIKSCITFKEIQNVVQAVDNLFDVHMKVYTAINSSNHSMIDYSSLATVEMNDTKVETGGQVINPTDSHEFLPTVNSPMVESVMYCKNGRWSCGICQEIFLLKDDLHKHILFHHCRKPLYQSHPLSRLHTDPNDNNADPANTSNQNDIKHHVPQDLMDIIIASNPSRNIRFTHSQRMAVQMCVDNFLLKKKRGPYNSMGGVRAINWRCVKDGKDSCPYSCVTLEGTLSEHQSRPHNHAEDHSELFDQKEARFQLRKQIALGDRLRNSTSIVDDLVSGSSSEKVVRDAANLCQAARRYKRNVQKRKRVEVTTPFVDTVVAVDTRDVEPKTKPKKKRKFRNTTSAYVIFSSQVRRTTTMTNPGLSFGEISKILSERWKMMSRTEKEMYEDLAKEDNAKRRQAASAQESQVVADDIHSIIDASSFLEPQDDEGEDLLQCHLCSAVLSNNNALQYHMIAHNFVTDDNEVKEEELDNYEITQMEPDPVKLEPEIILDPEMILEPEVILDH